MTGTTATERLLLKWSGIPDWQRKYFLIPLFFTIVVFVFLMVNIFMGRTGFPEFTPYLIAAFVFCAIATVGSAQYFKASFEIHQRLDGSRELMVRERFQTQEYSWPMKHQVFYYMNPIYTGRRVRNAPVLLLQLENESGNVCMRFREELGILYQPPVGWTQLDMRSAEVIPPGAKSYSSLGVRLLNLETLKEQLDRLEAAFPNE